MKTPFQEHLQEFNDFLGAQNQPPLSEQEYTNLCDDERAQYLIVSAFDSLLQALEILQSRVSRFRSFSSQFFQKQSPSPANPDQNEDPALSRSMIRSGDTETPLQQHCSILCNQNTCSQTCTLIKSCPLRLSVLDMSSYCPSDVPECFKIGSSTWSKDKPSPGGAA